MTVGFKRRAIHPARVDEASAIAAASSLAADPRAGDQPSKQPSQVVPSALATQASSGVYRIGQTYEVHLSELRPNPFNPRMIYTNAAVDVMVETLSRDGQQVAATAFVDKEGNLTLIDGEKRLRAARACGLVTLRVEIRPAPEADRQLYEHARATNLKRTEQTPLDDALRWKDLLGKRVYESQAQLAQMLQLPEETVSRTMRLAVLPSRIVMTLADQPELMKLRLLNSIREFWEKSDDERTLDLIRDIVQKSMGYREVDSRRRSLLAGPVAKPRAIREPLRYGEAKGELKTFPDGRMELSLAGLNEDQAEELRVLLVQTLKGASQAALN
jgi:ParB family chromosome partitioning protein